MHSPTKDVLLHGLFSNTINNYCSDDNIYINPACKRLFNKGTRRNITNLSASQ